MGETWSLLLEIVRLYVYEYTTKHNQRAGHGKHALGKRNDARWCDTGSEHYNEISLATEKTEATEIT